jgi:pantothenate kinase
VNAVELAAELLRRSEGQGRYIVAIAGPPGAGKSTLAEGLLVALDAVAPGRAAVVPMDGYHLDNAVLVKRGMLARKGAPETFDVDGLARDLARIRAGDRDVPVPVFDRQLDLARAAARVISRDRSLVLVEGNYLLLDRPPWRNLAPLFDWTILIVVPAEELRRRLVERWLDHGYDAVSATARAEGNDLPNAEVVRTGSRLADLVLDQGSRNAPTDCLHSPKNCAAS